MRPKRPATPLKPPLEGPVADRGAAPLAAVDPSRMVPIRSFFGIPQNARAIPSRPWFDPTPAPSPHPNVLRKDRLESTAWFHIGLTEEDW
ncbi:BZ3500_MvSof-1268-A1-R1_Chr3-1g05645 [Microbotryum saponariae]|uniref:BZ3500_MvSof-1268-A1-R1_Chr3-1g05645 protein n=1 Tax=Microbotryum saponariae TaxID=289078 RepID=A0A2X0M6I7_9BASI|nr:BZ3500_MvSof-1268-A1-R1_Chr3-1g05645 [Microbotryum saponariae]SDA04835.1 BZ3501_MvSof-1269-A2-R1_Chr3-1g05315 [Microbotryum saponariae]